MSARFARLRCVACNESRLVAWSRKGRGFSPSCFGRRMCATAANLPARWRRGISHGVEIAADATRVCVRRRDASVWCWGE